jgi:Glycosidases
MTNKFEHCHYWFKNAVLYCVDVDTFKDGNGDGIGDFIGLRQGLSYLAGLGISCIWLLAFHPSPGRDNGYDVTDYLGIHPDLGDFAAFMDEATARGIRVIVDLRNSVRTPMQWNAEPNTGFASPSVKKLRRPVIDWGEFDYRRVNVQAQRRG